MPKGGLDTMTQSKSQWKVFMSSTMNHLVPLGRTVQR